ncbi:hypothetical protein ANCDUO_12625 [Ancylostoma duodenale]|uniref:Uncharacterized protein n=1 Tax=Ancylostoma duodenale TaxID=51022 RepID=A0A0C2GJC7_9BILA|nr:hypothetical protein ANCDUO_12625 [Ancylostoma duodenale]
MISLIFVTLEKDIVVGNDHHPPYRIHIEAFGSLQQSDIRVERLSYPKSQDIEFRVSKRKVKELNVPVSLSKSKREQLEKLQSREPPPPSHLCFIRK